MAPLFINRNILSTTDLSKEDIEYILQTALALKKKNKPTLLNGKIMGSCFFEPSTRTRLSFETAMLRLGGNITGFADPNVTSAKKGETLADSMQVISGYVDVIVIRHPLEGTARRGAEKSEVPIINAGDGANQHPTQTLLDLFSIQECQGRIDNMNIALVGDLKYGRTVHSLSQALTHYNPRIYFVAPELLQIPDHITDELKAKGIKYSFHKNMGTIIDKVDILYMTRIQKERFSDPTEYERMKDIFILNKEMLKNVKKNMRVMHPLPRVGEISTNIDQTKYAYYFQQAKNGVYVRQALLGLVLGKL